MRINRIINLMNTVRGNKIYLLEMWDDDYAVGEYGWHLGELELIFRRPSTLELVDGLADLISEGLISSKDVNSIFKDDGVGIQFAHNDDESLIVKLTPVEELPDEELEPSEHTNMRKLFDRMDRALEASDWPLVVHTAASVFETLAKSIVTNPTVQNQSLGSWFALYRKHSTLSDSILDEIKSIFDKRNTEALAGHGSTVDPATTEKEARVMRELTRTIVKLERELSVISPQFSSP
ncbi:hypothetical protein X907_2366 [Glycocaulis alkaliphilus]|uniref:Uncharacterized protein n=1 Tax=Glycocaulis alkaliphilus TaxID=1434191 RepID=A0A3T0EC62_9PROT|nr:hypothetical protein X907_2366 [Glycocaulis alkaliphilus]